MSILSTRAPLPSIPKSPASRANTWVIAALLLASVLKLIWATHSIGSVDGILFHRFARAIDTAGLCELYPATPIYNHTPITGLLLWGLYKISGGDYILFAAAMRTLCVLADAAVVLALLRWRVALGNPPTWALVLLALSPVSLMVSGFHCNLDPLVVAVLFFAMLAAVLGRPLLCGGLFALACNIKVVPLMLAPVFFFYWLARGEARRFLLPVVAGMLLGSAPALMKYPMPYIEHVFGYGSVWGVWGVSYLLRLTHWAPLRLISFMHLSHEQLLIMALLKGVIVMAIIALAWRRRGARPVELPITLALAWIVFFTFAPGFGAQYLTWFAPFVLLLGARVYALLTALSSLVLFCFYHSTSGWHFPWVFALPKGNEADFWCPFGVPLWLAFVALLSLAVASRKFLPSRVGLDAGHALRY